MPQLFETIEVSYDLIVICIYKSVIGLYLGTNAFITNQAIK